MIRLTSLVQAAAQAPAIIFLDELDGLVPARSQASSGSDQIYASVVSTMLALMDGVADRGAVIVIGATNRCAIHCLRSRLCVHMQRHSRFKKGQGNFLNWLGMELVAVYHRPEAIDAALRRPGRFDREVYFRLPSTADRTEILRVHSQRYDSALF